MKHVLVPSPPWNKWLLDTRVQLVSDLCLTTNKPGDKKTETTQPTQHRVTQVTEAYPTFSFLQFENCTQFQFAEKIKLIIFEPVTNSS